MVKDLYQAATNLMHDSCIRMDEDFVGKPQDLYLWYSVGRSKNWVSGVAQCGSRITKTRNYLTLQFHGEHNPMCHTRAIMRRRKSAPVIGGFKSYYSSGGDSDNVESMILFSP